MNGENCRNSGANMGLLNKADKKKFRVSVKYKDGPLAGCYVVQFCGASYKDCVDMYKIWTAGGFDVLIIPMEVTWPDLRHTEKYKLKRG